MIVAAKYFRPMTDEEVATILSMRKVIGERIKWRHKKGDPRQHRHFRVGIVAPDNPGFDRDLHLYSEAYLGRAGWHWSVGILASGLTKNLARADLHGPHRNPDRTRVNGCMMHVWSEAYSDRHAVSAKNIIDCQSADHALMSFMHWASIEMIGNFQITFNEGEYGTL